MKNSNSRRLSALLAAIMLLGALASCSPKGDDETTSSVSTSTESERGTESDSASESASDPASESASESASDTTSDSASGSETETETDVVLEGVHGPLIAHADKLANNITMGFADGKRDLFTFANSQISVAHGTHPFEDHKVSYIKNSKGQSYLEDTMDVFVTMKSGNRYYASTSDRGIDANSYHIGYYYYDVRFENQDFLGQFKVTDSLDIPLKKVNGNQVKTRTSSNGITVSVSGAADDPYITFGESAGSGYDFLQLTIRSSVDDSLLNTYRKFRLFARTDGEYFTHDKNLIFYVYPDGEFHTYYIPIFKLAGIKENLAGLRIDLDHYSEGDTYEISEAKLIKTDNQDAPDALSICRTFHLYSDKMHHSVQFSSEGKDTENIANVGVETVIPVDKVSALLLHDKKGDHPSVEGVDFASLDYLAFDIKDTGIIGFILPADGRGGNIKVTLEGDSYVIEQTVIPKDGIIEYSEPDTLNANDLFFGSRIYTDETHDFAAFVKEARLELEPLTGKDIKVSSANSTENAAYLGYDSLRGVYSLYVDGDVFNNPYYKYPNKHFPVNFSISSKDVDRQIYIMTYNEIGCIECAVLLDEDQMLLPVPVQVVKNFSEEAGERNLYNLDDAQYSEALIPLTLKANEKYEYTLVNLYQNWGAFPLKQVSGIQFFTPYYHLSIGTTETNCLVPWYDTNDGLRLEGAVGALPDHRGLSSPLWPTQPQHNSAGTHRWLQYVNAEGNYRASECYESYVVSYGPVYGEVVMNNISDDGKIRISYTHIEMPQTDENRSYYEIKYEILEDVSFKDFSRDFEFYSVKDNDGSGYYTKLGYLDENNTYRIKDAARGKESVKYVLGDQCPYFSFFDMDDYSSSSNHSFDGTKSGYSNVSFIIKDSEFKLANAKDPGFAIINEGGVVKLSLDLGEFTLKAGDTISVNAIAMPWGSQEMDEGGNRSLAHAYTDVIDEKTGELYMDKNVRDVRENSCTDPFTVKSETDEVIDSPFVGRVRSKDGKSATFTLSGGENNMAVHVYGFDMLTVPKIEELVGGEWVAYNVSSFYSPDSMGNYHHYDGYATYYDGDGTYSYSFAVDMTGEVERTFRISASEAFEGWPNTTPELPEDPLTLYFDAMELNAGSSDPLAFSSSALLVEDGRFFARIGSKASRIESCINVFKHTSESEEAPRAGRYLVMRYRLPETNSELVKNAEFYLSTKESEPSQSNGMGTVHVLSNDGQWHVLIFDMQGFNEGNFERGDDGEYRLKLLRWDVFNKEYAKDVYFDIEYIGFDDDLDKIIKLNSDLKTITLMPAYEVFEVIDTESGEVISNVNPAPTAKPKPSDNGEPIKHVFELEELQAKFASAISCFESVDIIDGEYLRANPIGDKDENYATVYNNGNRVTGQYLIIKYRIPTTNIPDMNMELYTSTTGMDGIAKHHLSIKTFSDGEWHTVIVDLSLGGTSEYYLKNEDGKYVASYLRMDILNYKASADEYIDIASVAFADDLDAAKSYDKSGSVVGVYDIKAGEYVE